MRKVRPMFPVSQPLSWEPGFRPRPLLPALRRGKEGRAGEELEPGWGRDCIGGKTVGGDPGWGAELVDWVRTRGAGKED